MKSTKLIGCFIFFIITLLLFPLVHAESVRGKYVYDDGNRLSDELKLSLSSYLYGLDQRTGYEFILVFPSSNMTETEIIDWFNSHGVGKAKADTGAALFIFPDNSWFMSIGSGNDKVSVPYSKTQGDKILSNLSNDMPLSILRYVNAIGKKIDEPKPISDLIFNSVVENIDIILGWGAVIALILFLIQQVDGFQWHDFIFSGFIMIMLLLVIGFNIATDSYNVSTYSDYGIITSSVHSNHKWTQVVTTGKSTYVVHHTDYINDVTFKSYGLQDYSFTFSTTDNQGAYYHTIGELDGLTLRIDNNYLVDVFGFNDNSGGKTIGDGVWG